MLDFSCVQHIPSTATEPFKPGDKLLSVVSPAELPKPGSKALTSRWLFCGFAPRKMTLGPGVGPRNGQVFS